MKPSLLKLVRHFREMKFEFIVATLLFLIGTAVGMQTDFFSGFIEQQAEGLSVIAEQLSEASPFMVFLIIFLNNALKAVAIVFLGAIFGLLPIVFLVVNGLLLGHVLIASAEASGLAVWLIVLVGIMPHGFIELPAIIIASAYGMRFGRVVFMMFLDMLRPAHRRLDQPRIGQFFNVTAILVPVLVVALCIAAIIESTLTVWLVRG